MKKKKIDNYRIKSKNKKKKKKYLKIVVITVEWVAAKKWCSVANANVGSATTKGKQTWVHT